MKKKRNAYRILIVEPEGDRRLEQLNTGRRIILKYLRDMGLGSMD
jgi:hypothetical protein